MTFGEFDEVSSFGRRLVDMSSGYSRYMIGGPLDGETIYSPNPDHFMHRSMNSVSNPYLKEQRGSVAVDEHHYTLQSFGEGERVYNVLVLTTLQKNEAFYLFKKNMSKIKVAYYLDPMYTGCKSSSEESRRKYLMEHMIPVGPSGKIGKHAKKAVLMICYGAGVKKTVSESGLSRRRVKVMMKKIKSYGGMLREHRY